MEITLALCLPRDASSVSAVRRIAGQSLRSVGFLPGDVDDVQLAITEACSNVLRHAEHDEEYEVRVVLQDTTLRMEIVEGGNGFDGEEHGHHDADDGSESGRGIQLMRAIVDDLRFTYEPDRGSVVTMTKQMHYDGTPVFH